MNFNSKTGIIITGLVVFILILLYWDYRQKKAQEAAKKDGAESCTAIPWTEYEQKKQDYYWFARNLTPAGQDEIKALYTLPTDTHPYDAYQNYAKAKMKEAGYCDPKL